MKIKDLNSLIFNVRATIKIIAQIITRYAINHYVCDCYKKYMVSMTNVLSSVQIFIDQREKSA